MSRLRSVPVALFLAAVTLLGAAGLLIPGANSASASTAGRAQGGQPTALWSCSSRRVVKPAAFTITCADGYVLLSSTHWTSWSTKLATGTTKFGINFCNPYCAASKITYFPKSTVRLSAPVKTAHGELFSKLAVTYKLHGKNKRYTFSWSGDPGFKR